MKDVFDKVSLKNLTLRNRLICSATWEALAEPDGGINEDTYEIYRELAKGGVGGIITGFTSVADDDSYFGGMMRLSHDELIPQYRALTDIIHAENCPVISQLALGAFYRGYNQVEPDEMTHDEIKHVINLFIDAAKRAKQANFDGVQIHAAHFFLSRFISPRVNHRNDSYGGNTENRTRILFEILDGIKNAVPELHVTIKINCSDFTLEGLTKKRALKFVHDSQKLESIQSKLAVMEHQSQ